MRTTTGLNNYSIKKRKGYGKYQTKLKIRMWEDFKIQFIINCDEDGAMLLEINSSLLGAVAIVATLIGITFKTKFENRWAAYATILYGASSVISTSVLGDFIISPFMNQAFSNEVRSALTFLSLTLFMIATEIIIVISFKRFWRIGRVERRNK